MGVPDRCKYCKKQIQWRYVENGKAKALEVRTTVVVTPLGKAIRGNEYHDCPEYPHKRDVRNAGH